MPTNNYKHKVNFLCIGAPKSATTWLYNCLIKHPQVHLPKKEINYFNDKHTILGREIKSNYHHGETWYNSIFSPISKNKIIGDFSVAYLADKNAPKRIFKYNPNIKIIIILREPIKRLASHLSYYSSKGAIDRFKKINNINDNNQLFKHIINNEKYLISIGKYSEHLTNYKKYFRDEQILIIKYDQIIDNPHKIINKICDFLNLDKNESIIIKQKLNSSIDKINLHIHSKLYNFYSNHKSLKPVNYFLSKIKVSSILKKIIKRKIYAKTHVNFTKKQTKKLEKIYFDYKNV